MKIELTYNKNGDPSLVRMMEPVDAQTSSTGDGGGVVQRHQDRVSGQR